MKSVLLGLMKAKLASASADSVRLSMGRASVSSSSFARSASSLVLAADLKSKIKNIFASEDQVSSLTIEDFVEHISSDFYLIVENYPKEIRELEVVLELQNLKGRLLYSCIALGFSTKTVPKLRLEGLD